jgi:hypothetical protein
LAGLEPVHSAALLAQKKKKRKLMSKKTTGSELVTGEAQGEENTQKEKIKKSTSLAIEDDLKRSALLFSFKIIVKLQQALNIYFFIQAESAGRLENEGERTLEGFPP